jgi:dipeptidyl-peptidase III
MKQYLKLVALATVLASCDPSKQNEMAGLQSHKNDSLATDSAATEKQFIYETEQFADLRILRYDVPGFEDLSLQNKTLVYYLYEAALCGRDIGYDQNYKYNLAVRKTLEAILNTSSHDNGSEDFKKLVAYAKRVWFSNGIHHHYSHDKFMPECSEESFRHVLMHVKEDLLPLQPNQTKQQFIDFITPVIFDPKIAPKRVSLDSKNDLVTSSSVNFYEGVTEKEATAFYEAMAGKSDSKKPMYGVNSKLVKENGKLVEKVWMVGGMYSNAIEKIVYWLGKAVTVAENANQKAALEALIQFYKSGSVVDFDNYNLAWIKDTTSMVDVVNGFIEVYHDPLGYKGSFESVVSIRDVKATERIATIGKSAQWFEDHSTILPEHKKKLVTGVSGKVINAVVESGDAAPSTPIGINLPNNEWIREKGSKSVNLGNIVDAYDQAAPSGLVAEFYYNDAIRQNIIINSTLSDKLHTDMHEVIGHASGQIEKGVGTPHETLKNYASALEEGRADLVALYYLMDTKLIELGVMPSLDCGRAAYDEYITNGLIVQLARIKPGDNIEEAHMRNRKMVAEWVYEKGKKENTVEKKYENGKTYFVVNDYEKLRVLFGELLKEVQRIISKGDYKAGHNLIENYGVKIDKKLHEEVLNRYSKLNIAPYKGFIQPELVPVMQDGNIIDIKIQYPEDFKKQMLFYGKNYSFLPAYN